MEVPLGVAASAVDRTDVSAAENSFIGSSLIYGWNAFDFKVGDISDQLEAEEQHRQKLQLEKGSLEQSVKAITEDHAVLEDKHTKLEKEKKSMETRMAELSAQLSDEEERSKQLLKLKSKFESSISELEEKLSKEQATRQDLERAKRRLETEVSEKSELGVDHARLIDDLKQQLANLEATLAQTQQKLDDEVMAKTVTMKQVSSTNWSEVLLSCFHLMPNYRQLFLLCWRIQ